MKKLFLLSFILLSTLVGGVGGGLLFAQEKQLACPSNSVYGFDYVQGGNGPTSADLGRDDGYSTRAFCSFNDNVYWINGLHFYGYFINFSSYTSDNSRLQCDANGNPTAEIEFEIRFYKMASDGSPGEKVCETYASILGNNTGVGSDFGSIFTFDVDLPDSLDLQNGWFSVAACADGEHHDGTFALFGHLGAYYAGSQSVVQINDGSYMQSATPPIFCLLGTGSLIPGCTPPEPDPDDPEDEDGLPRPKPTEATNVTEAGFTANWTLPKKYYNVNGYEVWTYTTLQNAQEGEEFYFLQQDFSSITGGTLDNPVSMGDYTDDSEDFNRSGWYVINPLHANGALGVNNENYGVLNGSIMSPMFDLRCADGKVYVSMTMCGRNVSKVNVFLYQGRTMLCQKTVDVTNDWYTEEVELTGGCEDAYIIIEPDANSRGFFYLKDLAVVQYVKAGETPYAKYHYDYTLSNTDTSLFVDTSTPLYGNDVLCYRMTSFKDEDRSAFTDYVFVTPPEPEPEPEPTLPADPADGQWTDLGLGANCYVVEEAGYYEFEPLHVDNSQIQNIKTVNWLWAEKQTVDDEVQDLIGQVRFDATQNKVRFATTGQHGNALLAAFDAKGKIIWTWHIWMPEKAISSVTYDNDSEFMDRFLGAMSGNRDDGNKTQGLVWQWGRLAPFFGGYAGEGTAFNQAYAWTTLNTNLASVAANYDDLVWQFRGSTEVSSVEEGIANPMIHYSGQKNQGQTDEDRRGYWYTEFPSGGNKLWDDGKKTNYDPSPLGWRVAGSDDFPSDFRTNVKANKQSNGIYYVNQAGDKDWIPANSGRNYIDGKFDGIGSQVFFWESSKADWSGTQYPQRYIYTLASDVNSHAVGNRTFAHVVKSVRDDRYKETPYVSPRGPLSYVQNNDAATLKVVLPEDYTLVSCQWTYLTDELEDEVTIEGATSPEYTPSTAELGETEYFCHITYYKNDAPATTLTLTLNSVFVTITEPSLYPFTVTSKDQLTKDHIYTFTTSRGAWTIDSEATRLGGTNESGFSGSTADMQQFAVLNIDGGLRIYSPKAKKFVNRNGKVAELKEGKTCAWDFEQDGTTLVAKMADEAIYVNLGGSNQMVLDSWSTHDAGNKLTVIAEAEFTLEQYNEALEIYAVVDPEPDPEPTECVYYQVQSYKDESLYITLNTTDNTVVLTTEPVTLCFWPVDGQDETYYISNLDRSGYIGYKGSDSWTMCATPANKARWTVTLSDGAFELISPDGTGQYTGLGADDMSDGAKLWGDKSVNRSGYDADMCQWWLNETTAIEAASQQGAGSKEQVAGIYDLTGRKVSMASIETMASMTPGLVIINGKKVLIK